MPPLDARLAPGSRLTALVVDDSTANRRILASLLESAGVRVITASGGLEAIDLARAHRPEVVFMDLKMNDLDGPRRLDGSHRIQRRRRTGHCCDRECVWRYPAPARDAGCIDYLPKPIRAQSLFAMLQTHIGVRFVSGMG